jgi:hypothetical protein
MGWSRAKVVWSPCEIDYLKANREIRSVNELSLYLAKSRNAINKKLKELDGKLVPTTNKRGTSIGKRADIIVNGKPAFFRSGWEANVARLLNHRNISWEYEPEVFFYEKIKRGTNSYCPDFRTKTFYLEVKGYLDSKGRAAIRRFKKYYPDKFAKLRAVVGRPGTKADLFFKELGVPIYAYMNDLNKKYSDKLEHWE